MGETSERKIGGTPRVDLNLLIAGRCNLACHYCYQDERICDAGMTQQVFEAAVEAACALRPRTLKLCFSGGEPLLETELLRAAILQLQTIVPSGVHSSCVVVTNGTLLTRGVIEFFVEHEIAIQLSMDGGRVAQSHRGPWTFDVLDGLLGDIRARHPEFFRRRLSVAMTITESSMDLLSDSVRYLLGKDVTEIRMSPQITRVRDWHEGMATALDRHLTTIAHVSVEHWRGTGHVPVTFLRDDPVPTRMPNAAGFICRAPTGTTFTVDPDGRGWVCPALVGSMQRLPTRALQAVGLLELGNVQDDGFLTRLQALPDSARGIPEFSASAARRSAGGPCDDCDCLESCLICPAAMYYSAEKGRPFQVPGIHCAFYRGTKHARLAFAEGIGGTGVTDSLTGTLRWIEDRMKTSSIDPEGT